MDKPAPQSTGETHYSKYAIEPIQFIEANKLPYHEANVIKYVSRWRDKNGVEDLKKAKWYIDRLIELEKTPRPKLVWRLNPMTIRKLSERIMSGDLVDSDGKPLSVPLSGGGLVETLRYNGDWYELIADDSLHEADVDYIVSQLGDKKP